MSGPGDELVEWVDEHDEVIAVVTRRRIRAENLRHRSVAIIVLDTTGRLVVHRRSSTKDLAPDHWDVCAGGVVSVGEDPATAAARELAEELGLVDARIEPLGVTRWDGHSTREICHVFRTVHDGPYRFVDGEVSEVRALDAGELAALMASEPVVAGSIAIVFPHLEGFEPPAGSVG